MISLQPTAQAGAGPQRSVRLNAARTLVLPLLVTIPAAAANWPAWRGPTGNGISDDQHLPVHWSATNHVRWHVPLPGPGNSTPIVWSNRVFLTQAMTNANRRTVMCLDRRAGQPLWQSGPVATAKDSGGSANPPCTPSAVTDGERVIAWFGSSGVYCYDLDGKELWHRDLGLQSHGWGYASSPVLYTNLCLLNFGPGERSFLIALDKRTGETVWQYHIPPMSADAKWEDFGGDTKDWQQLGQPTMPEVTGSCATPIVVNAAGGDELVLALPLRVMGFAPLSGQRLWSCEGLNTGAYGSPCFGEGLLAVSGSGLKNAAMAIRPGGRGDVTKTHRLWHTSPASSKACIGSGVISRGHLYQITNMGFALCQDLQTGQTVWDERLTGSGARKGSWSSPVLAGDRLYIPNQSADVFVLRASPKFECLATNSLGGEQMNASLAISEGEIFIRTHQQLWCVSEHD